MTNPFVKVQSFLAEVALELKKSSWPTRKELVDSTIVVLVSFVVLGMFVATADYIFVRIIRSLLETR
jgi:preprotein translocase subunit SecE